MIFNYLSGLKEDSGVVCVNEVIDIAVRMSDKCLNEKRLKILDLIADCEEPMTITTAVDLIAEIIECPKSTVWTNVNFLKEVGLLKNGRGLPVRVTSMGRIILERKLEDNGNGI